MLTARRSTNHNISYMKKFSVKSKVQKFPGSSGWFYLPIPHTYREFGKKPVWGLVPAEITIGQTTWRKSLLPKGDGTMFIALNAKVRKAENLQLGDEIEVEYTIL